MIHSSRRTFLKQTAVLSTAALLEPAIAFANQAETPVRIGVIGCGGRGTAVISAMSKNTNIHIVAIADLFDDQLQKGRDKFSKLNTDKGLPAIDAANAYQGSKAYAALLANREVEAVLISSPSYTHPDYFEAAVAAGKHVYCEKPAAIDVAGCKKVERIGASINGKVSAVFGFIVPYASAYAELIQRVIRGGIGEIVNGQLYYLAGKIGLSPYQGLSYDEARVRNHYHFQELCGGILTEQSIHLLDVANRILRAVPIDAVGTGGKNQAEPFGDTWTHYQVLYRYPNQVNVSLHATQLGDLWGDVCVRFVGTKGIAEAHYSGGTFITGENEWDSGILRSDAKLTASEQQAGKFSSSLHDSDKNKGIVFIDSIMKKQYRNEAKATVDSTLTAILGRRAAESGNRVTWEENLYSSEDLDAGINLAQFDKPTRK